MKHNFIFEPSRNYHEQHMLPISPQNFDPLDKNREAVSQKKTIFSTSTKPKAAYDIIFESDNNQARVDDFGGEADLKRMLSKEMKLHLDNLKGELLESFSIILRDRSTGKINNDELQDIKRQILYNKRKFDEIQENLGHLSQQYSEVNSVYGKEAENYRSIGSFSNLSRNERQNESASALDSSQKQQLEMKFKALKQGLHTDIQNAIKMKGKNNLNQDAAVGELKQIKYSFENDLKQNFEMINSRVKRAEENLNEIMRKKREHMDVIREELVSSMNHQETAMNQELSHIENVLKSKCEQNQAKAIVSNEINKRMELFKTEIESLRKNLKENQEEMERVETIVNRKLENLDFDMKRQFVELQNYSQKSGGASQQNQELLERKIQKLNSESEGYHKTIQQLRAQVEEITKFHKVLQSQVLTPSSQNTILRLEDKIKGLQNHIIELETFIRRQETAKVAQTRSIPDMDAFSRSAPVNMKIELADTSFGNYMQDKGKPQSTKGSPDKNPQAMYGEDGIAYYGDPKIKSIIDEFQSKKKQVQAPDNRKSPVPQQTTFNNFNEGMMKSQESNTPQNNKKLKHAKILAQINYFINGTTSNFLDDEEDAEIYCNLDDDGFIFDEDGDFVLNAQGQKVKLTPEQIDRFNNNNMIE